FEDEDSKLTPISFDGLVMPKVLAFRDDSSKASGTASTMPLPRGGPPPGPGGKAPPTAILPGGTPGGKDVIEKEPAEDDYPKPEEQLIQLAKTLEALKGKGDAKVAAPPSRFRKDDIEIFSRNTPENSTGTGMGPGALDGPGLSKGKGGT